MRDVGGAGEVGGRLGGCEDRVRKGGGSRGCGEGGEECVGAQERE